MVLSKAVSEKLLKQITKDILDEGDKGPICLTFQNECITELEDLVSLNIKIIQELEYVKEGRQSSTVCHLPLDLQKKILSFIRWYYDLRINKYGGRPLEEEQWYKELHDSFGMVRGEQLVEVDEEVVLVEEVALIEGVALTAEVALAEKYVLAEEVVLVKEVVLTEESSCDVVVVVSGRAVTDDVSGGDVIGHCVGGDDIGHDAGGDVIGLDSHASDGEFTIDIADIIERGELDLFLWHVFKNASMDDIDLLHSKPCADGLVSSHLVPFTGVLSNNVISGKKGRENNLSRQIEAYLHKGRQHVENIKQDWYDGAVLEIEGLHCYPKPEHLKGQLCYWTPLFYNDVETTVRTRGECQTEKTGK
jgi:hypothetical protein